MSNVIIYDTYNVNVTIENDEVVGVQVVAGFIHDVIAGTNVSIDKTDPLNPVISATGGSTLTNGNGTTANGSAVDLGGVINNDVFISGPNYNIFFGEAFGANKLSGVYYNILDPTSSGARIAKLDVVSTSSTQGISVLSQDGANFTQFVLSTNRLEILPTGTFTYRLDFGSDATGDTYTRNAAGYLIRKGITSATSIATLTVNSDTTYLAIVTAQAEAITIANPTGTPFTGQELSIRLTDNGTSRAISFGNAFVEFETFPTATTLGKRMYLGFVYNGSGWDYMGSRTQL